MRKRIITLILSLFVIGFTQAQTVIFDPATYTGELKSGMSIIDVDGTKYLQVVVDEWNSTINIPAVTTILGTQMTGYVKYAQGTSTIAAGLTMADIGSIVQVMDTVHRVPNPWGAGTIPSNTSIGTRPAVNAFTYCKKDLTAEMTNAHQVQFAGQESKNWGATKGDTLWVGRIVTVDASVIMDPASLDVSTLPAGMEVVDLSGTKYLKVKVAGWDTWLDIADFDITNKNKAYATIKYEQGESTVAPANSQVLISFKSATSADLGSLSVNPAPTALTDLVGSLSVEKTIAQIQFAVQETSGDWAGQTGAYIYVGKITSKHVEAEVAVAPNNGVLEFTDLSVVVDDQYDDAFDASEVYPINRVANGTVAGTAAAAGAEVVAGNGDSYGEFQMVADVNNLYLYVSIEDNDIVDLGASTQPWMNDGLEFFIDIQNRRYVATDRITSEQHQFRFNIISASKEFAKGDKGLATFFGDNDTTNIPYQVVKGSSSYTMEIAIPWATICRTQSGTNADAVADVAKWVTEGRKIAVEVSVLDASALDARKSILNWSNKTGVDEAYNTAEFWGEVTLQGGFPVSVGSSKEVTKFNVYPNPTTGELNLDLDNVAKVEIYNVLGAKVQSVNMVDNKVDVSALSMGVYVVKATTVNGEVAVSKFNKK